LAKEFPQTVDIAQLKSVMAMTDDGFYSTVDDEHHKLTI
jgi:hypothetical protein